MKDQGQLKTIKKYANDAKIPHLSQDKKKYLINWWMKVLKK